MPYNSPEERARIARENGAKSRGPVTPEGKAASSRNAIKTGEHANSKSVYTPHPSVLTNEDRQGFFKLVDELIQIYVPANQLALDIVNEIAQARWLIDRLQHCLTLQWQFALAEIAAKPCPVIPEVQEAYNMATAAKALYSETHVLRMTNEIRRHHTHIARLERRLRFVHANFPAVASPQPVETEELTETETPETEENEPIIYVTENTPRVIEAYRAQYPNHKIVVLPPDNVAKGIEEPDDLPLAPRRAA